MKPDQVNYYNFDFLSANVEATSSKSLICWDNNQ